VFSTCIEEPQILSFKCPNNRSATFRPEIVNNVIDDEIQKGYLVGPSKTSPFSNYKVSPIAVGERKYS